MFFLLRDRSRFILSMVDLVRWHWRGDQKPAPILESQASTDETSCANTELIRRKPAQLTERPVPSAQKQTASRHVPPIILGLAVVLSLWPLSGCTTVPPDADGAAGLSASESLPEFTAGDERATTRLMALSLHEKVEGSLDTRAAHNYLIEAAAGDSFHIEVAGRGPTDVAARLLDPQGMLLASGEDSLGTPHVTLLFTAAQGGLYTIRATAHVAGDYQVQVWPHQGPVPIATGGDRTHATVSIGEIVPGQEVPTTFSSLSEARNFIFDARAGESISIQTRSEGAELRLMLLSPEGSSMSAAVNQLTARATTPGRYTLRIIPQAFAVDRATSGPIQILLRKESDSP